MTTDIDEALASYVDYLMMTGYVCGGWQMARAALVASKKDAAGEDRAFHQTKLATGRFYAEKFLSKVHALRETILSGASGAIDISIEQF